MACQSEACCKRHPRACARGGREGRSASPPPSAPPNATASLSPCLLPSCPRSPNCRACGLAEVVPPLLHFVWIGPSCPPLRALLSLISAIPHLPPSSITLWSRHLSCTGAIEQCWLAFGAVQRSIPSWDRIAAERSFRTHPHSMRAAHQSDVIRLHLLNTYGGVYLDSDAFVLRDLTTWRRCDFAMGAEMNAPYPPKLNNGVLLARRGSVFGRLWWENLQTWDGTGWDDHSCGWPWRQCAQSPHLLAASPLLGTILPPKSFPESEGARLNQNHTELMSLLNRRYAVHFVAFRNWVKEGGRTLWEIVEIVLRNAAAAAKARTGRPYNYRQQKCIKMIRSRGIAGLWETSASSHLMG